MKKKRLFALRSNKPIGKLILSLLDKINDYFYYDGIKAKENEWQSILIYQSFYLVLFKNNSETFHL